MAESIIHAENNTFLNVCFNMIQIVSKGTKNSLTAILTPEQAKAVAAILTNAPKQTVVSENPVVHVPMRDHVAMTNKIAALEDAVKTLRELRDYDAKEIATLQKQQPLDLGRLINSLPPDVNKKVSLHDLKRICDKYNE